jgi:hypothetical protein
VARTGDTVEVAGGTYPGQALTRDPAKAASAAKVVFRPSAGARVILGGLKFGTSVTSMDGPRDISVSNMRIVSAEGKELSVAAFGGTDNVLWENLDAGNFYLNGVRNFTVRGGNWGPCTSSGNQAVDRCSNSKIDRNPLNDRITIDGALFHDYRIVNGSGAHFECMFIAGGTNITIKNSRFRDCEFYNIFLQFHGSPFDGLRIERNHFGTPWNGRGVQNRVSGVTFSGRGYVWKDVLVKRNSFTTAIQPDDGDSGGWVDFRIVENIGDAFQDCRARGAVMARNIWRRGACSSADLSVPFGYAVNAGALAAVAAEAAAVRRAFSGAASGFLPARIARDLRGARLPAPTGRGWDDSAVRTILGSKVYVGGAYGAPGAHPAIVSRARWRAAQRVLGAS